MLLTPKVSKCFEALKFMLIFFNDTKSVCEKLSVYFNQKWVKNSIIWEEILISNDATHHCNRPQINGFYEFRVRDF